MWKHGIFIWKVIQSCGHLKPNFSQDTGFHENTSRHIRRFAFIINFNLFILEFFATIGLIKFLTGDAAGGDDSEFRRYILGGVFQLIYQGCNVGLIAFHWTFHYRCFEMLWMLNVAYKSSKRRRLVATKKEKRTELSTDEFKFAFVTWAAFIGGFAVVAVFIFSPLILPDTPAHIMLSYFVDVSTEDWKVTVFCITYMGVIYFFAAYPTYMACIVAALLFMYEFKYSLPNITEYKRKTPDFQTELLRYRGSYLQLENFNRYGHTFIVALMAAGFWFSVCATFICIKFHSTLPGWIIAFFAIANLCTLCNTFGYHRLAYIPLFVGEDFHDYWINHLKRKLEKRQFMSCRPLVIRAGSLFMIRPTVLMATFDETVNQIVNLLIMVT